jgi:hypothetical protein
MLVQNQSIEWVVFSMLSVCCGLEIARRQISHELSYGSESDIAPAYRS